MPKKETKLVPYQIVQEGSQRTLRINYEHSKYIPDLENSPLVMRDVILKLLELKNVNKVELIQKQEYVYDSDQTKLLQEIAEIYDKLIHRDKILEFEPSDPVITRFLHEKMEELRRILMHLLIMDPVAAYVELTRGLREEQIAKTHERSIPDKARELVINRISSALLELGNTGLIKLATPYLPGYKLGDRTIYRQIFKPEIKPYFIYTKLATSYPSGSNEIDSYKVGETKITVFDHPDDVRFIYHIIPPEFQLSQERYELLEQAKSIIAQHKPSKEEFIDVRRTREVFFDVEKDLLADLANSNNIKLKPEELEKLTQVLLRYTIGFGLIEVLLEDPKVQDVVINAPVGNSPVFIVHQDYGECKTNITITPREAESWATKLRMISGRPLDEANPVLDTSLALPTATSRVSAIQEPLSPDGLAFAFRRHRSSPWTLPLFIQHKMLTPLAAGLLSFLVDGGRTMLIAGTRSAGKTSLLSALMLEIMRTNRIISSEDTLELPIAYLNSLGYDIQSLKVQSVITGGRSEVPAEEGIRASLRLGDSCLIVGEVRGVEAKALYEAMRVGAMANVVAGTIHGESPYAVFDRVVNDLGVPITSFKATDIILVANQVRSASGLEKNRRVVQLSEVRKYWTKDPLAERGFSDLLTYDAKADNLNPTADLLEGESDILKSIAGRVREWTGNWDAIWANIQLRANIKEELVNTATKLKKFDLLEAPFVVKSNDEFHRISQLVKEQSGITDADRVLKEWRTWFKNQIK